MPGPTDLTRAYLRRAIDLKRFENGLAQRTVAVLERARDDIVARLMRVNPTSEARVRLEQLQAQVNETLRSAYADLDATTTAQLRGLAQAQSAFTTAALNRALGSAGAGALAQSVVMGETMLASIVDTNPVQGAVMGDWWAKQAGDVAFRFRQQMQIGLAQSETVEQLVQRVRGTWTGNGFTGGLMSFKSNATRQAESLVRTAAMEVSNRAQMETLRANDDITSEWQFVASLDEDTCEECMALDGTTWAYDDDSAPIPPLHFRCRCNPVAVVDWNKLGIEPPDEGTRASKDPTTGEGTVVPASTTYEDWLRDQPPEVQADILGAGKAEMFRDGSITLGDLVRSDGSVVTLAQLQAQTEQFGGAPPAPDVAPVEEQFAAAHPETTGAVRAVETVLPMEAASTQSLGWVPLAEGQVPIPGSVKKLTDAVEAALTDADGQSVIERGIFGRQVSKRALGWGLYAPTEGGPVTLMPNVVLRLPADLPEAEVRQLAMEEGVVRNQQTQMWFRLAKEGEAGARGTFVVAAAEGGAITPEQMVRFRDVVNGEARFKPLGGGTLTGDRLVFVNYSGLDAQSFGNLLRDAMFEAKLPYGDIEYGFTKGGQLGTDELAALLRGDEAAARRVAGYLWRVEGPYEDFARTNGVSSAAVRERFAAYREALGLDPTEAQLARVDPNDYILGPAVRRPDGSFVSVRSHGAYEGAHGAPGSIMNEYDGFAIQNSKTGAKRWVSREEATIIGVANGQLPASFRDLRGLTAEELRLAEREARRAHKG